MSNAISRRQPSSVSHSMQAIRPKHRSRSAIAAPCIVMLLLGLVWAPSSARGEDSVRTVRKLNEAKPWDQFADSQLSIRVEGRLGSSGGGQFRLLKCDVKFMIDPMKLKQVPGKSTVEVKGRFKRDGQSIYFAADQIKVMPSYLSQYETLASRLLSPSAGDWYELGNWASDRARFYEDEELEKKATEAFLAGVDVEYKSLGSTDFEGRFALARKITELNLPKRRAMELLHEGLHVQWSVLQKSEPVNPVAWQRFTKDLAEQLPGTHDVVKSPNAEWKQSYEQNPMAVYHQADNEQRNLLHRLFFVMVTRKILLFGESNDGHDGDSIADQIEKQIPEERALAEKHRLLKLSYRLSNITSSTRPEIENLAQSLRKRNRLEEARQAVGQWIRAHEPRLKEDGVIGRLQLADEYLTLLNDEASAVENLKEAYSIEPSFEAVKSKLVSLGYHWDQVRWTKTAPADPSQPGANAVSPTGIRKGMTATELRTLLGQPSSLTRAITARGTTEVWCFGPRESTQLVIRLEQKGRDADARVTSFPGQ